MGQNPRETKERADANPPLCAEAQADGVPCWELGRYCETCERARPKAPAPLEPDRSGK